MSDPNPYHPNPYRPPDALLARAPGTAPVWESFVTWSVAAVSILVGLVWWFLLAVEVMSWLGVEGMSPTFGNWRYWFVGALFSTLLAAGVSLLMSRRITLALYGVFAACISLVMIETGTRTPLVVVLVAGLSCMAWAFFLLRRGRFRRPMT